MTIGSTIKALRRAKNLTQEDLAEYLGISPKAVSQWECERTAPDISMLAPLASIFDVTADRLLGIDINSPDGDYYFYAQYIESAYTQMADIYASRSQAEKTIECLSAAVGFAAHFDAIDPDDIHSSPAAKGVICGEIWWNGSHNSCYNLLDKLTDKNNTQYDFIRGTKEYNDFLIRLRDMAK